MRKIKNYLPFYLTLTLRHSLPLSYNLAIMKKYSVKELAELASVSVRTLHYYDQIGLLKPAFRSEKGYRFYGRSELLVLQQILFYKELGFTLKEIEATIKDANFDLMTALENHKKKLKNQLGNIHQLLKTIDHTINELKHNKMMKDEEIYAGFSPQEMESTRAEVTKRWGADELKATEERIRAMGKDGWNKAKQKGEEINQLLADLMDLPVESINVQRAIELHFRHLNLFYEVSKERYLGLANLYVEDERFKAHYDKYKLDLAFFIKDAIQIFCNNGLKIGNG